MILERLFFEVRVILPQSGLENLNNAMPCLYSNY